MSLFLKNVALYGVKDLLHVINSSAEIKNKLKQLVENGIRDKTVGRLSVYDGERETSTE